MMTVYLLHFEQPISSNHTTQHYLGYASDLDARLNQHRAGQGARLVQVAQERRIGWRLVRTWAGGRMVERRLKRQKNAPRMCPVCNGRPLLVDKQSHVEPPF